ncbi:hypothetical protein [Nitrospirillum sp. BR 11163]|uniref:hypothetical protein n=1 Tax=Nitrospirillum sp. BR 11163 TaxID=3104323 RepID=UPI002AFEE1E0|nr:hypothetical protein [Nitrospirillum sp. BR 11163]MEA1674065.1 hypothetical protein [Nitrospirillum sp. BR 11163]
MTQGNSINIRDVEAAIADVSTALAQATLKHHLDERGVKVLLSVVVGDVLAQTCGGDPAILTAAEVNFAKLVTLAAANAVRAGASA